VARITMLDKGWARDNAAQTVLTTWATIYPEVALHLGDDPDFQLFVDAIRDLRTALR
jgi:hypothetical protein